MKTEESKMKEMYRETFTRVHTPEGVRSRILNTDVDAAAAESHGAGTERSRGRRTGGRRRFSMVMAACLLVVLVSGTALAVSSGDGLKNWFEASWKSWNNQELGEEQTAMIDSLTTPLGVSQTVGDVTVTADSIAYSDGYFWIMLYAEGVKMDPDEAYGFAKTRWRSSRRRSKICPGDGAASQMLPEMKTEQESSLTASSTRICCSRFPARKRYLP